MRRWSTAARPSCLPCGRRGYRLFTVLPGSLNRPGKERILSLFLPYHRNVMNCLVYVYLIYFNTLHPILHEEDLKEQVRRVRDSSVEATECDVFIVLSMFVVIFKILRPTLTYLAVVFAISTFILSRS
jgi:hypothetical protein